MIYRSRQRRTRKHRSDRRGAMLVLICVMIFAFLVTVAFSVDIAYMHLVRAELRTATDAAAKAAAESLARTQSADQAIQDGTSIAAENLVAGKGLELRVSDFEIGRSTQDSSGRYAFVAGGIPSNSVRVTGSRTSRSSSGNVGLFFGRIFNVSSFEPTEHATATFIERDIVLVLDRSGSMLDEGKWIQLNAAVATFLAILDTTPVTEKVGMASYSTDATRDLSLSTDLSRVTSTLSRLTPFGFTNISGGIDAGKSILNPDRSRQFVERTMIVLTDGLQNVGRPARLAAQEVAAEGTTIHTITFGTDADQASMQEVARIGKGRSFHARDGAELQQVFREIAITMCTVLTD